MFACVCTVICILHLRFTNNGVGLLQSIPVTDNLVDQPPLGGPTSALVTGFMASDADETTDKLAPKSEILTPSPYVLYPLKKVRCFYCK